MTEPFIGEIRPFGFNFAPRDWAPCNGQLLSIARYTGLFSIIGTAYGGDGKTTFGLPNLTNVTAPLGAGSGPGLTPRTIGEVGGVPSVTLSGNQTAHGHQMFGSVELGDLTVPTPSTWLARSVGWDAYADPDSTLTNLIESTITPGTGGGAPHNNLMPFQTVNYCIAVAGIFPHRPEEADGSGTAEPAG